VGRHDDEHLRRFLAARDRGDAAAMRQWWEKLVIDFYDRMDGFVAAAHLGRLDAEEHELAVGLALARFSNRLMHTYTGTSMGELVNATKTLARGICIDVQRMSVRARRYEAASLDEEERPAWETGESLRRHDDEERSAEVRDFLDWALPQIGEARRRVLELTFDGAELDEIVQELGISRDNAYQRRCRGMKDLAKLKERYDS
jgi:RNA polymerase sigma factor (sigma-70 family)